MTFEVCVFTIEEALRAQRAGAHRVELNADRGAGGATPSYGTMTLAAKRLSLGVVPMVRARQGGFVFSDSEFEVMLEDARLAASLGVDSIVTGVLTPDSRLDVKRMAALARLGVPVACHLAYERIDPAEKDRALEQLIDIGVTRLLYTGRPATYEEAVARLGDMLEKARGRISIMTCDMAVVPPERLGEFVKTTGVQEYHLWDVCSKYDVGTYARTQDPVDLQEMVDEEKLRARMALLEGA